MNIENTQSQMRKGILEFCILSVIRRGEAYPSEYSGRNEGSESQYPGRNPLPAVDPVEKCKYAYLPLGGK